MKAILFKREDRYDLYANTDHKLASTALNPFGKLSKENCDEIFGVFDVEKLAEEEVFQEYYDWGGEVFREDYLISKRLHFIEGFNKAMELNKDKVFTKQDITNAMNRVWDWCEDEKDKDCSVMDELIEKHIQSLQQPTEIEVEIEMKRIPDGLDESCHIQYAKVPKLDSEGNLILKKL